MAHHGRSEASIKTIKIGLLYVRHEVLVVYIAAWAAASAPPLCRRGSGAPDRTSPPRASYQEARRQKLAVRVLVRVGPKCAAISPGLIGGIPLISVTTSYLQSVRSISPWT